MVAAGEFTRSSPRQARGVSWLQAGAGLLALCAVAAVLVAQGGASKEELLETKLNHYLGDHTALTADDARKQAVSDSPARVV